MIKISRIRDRLTLLTFTDHSTPETLQIRIRKTDLVYVSFHGLKSGFYFVLPSIVIYSIIHMHQLSRWCLESRCQEILFTFSSRYSLSTRPAPGYTFHCKSPNTSSLTYCTYTGYYCPRSCWGALIVFTFHCGEVNFS